MTGDHYVYQYVDAESRETAYVGYGKSASRAISHGTSHNRNLKEWLKSARYEIRIAGPYEIKAVALDVESAVISATNPRYNIQPGNARRFRPLGVPDEYAERIGLPPLTLAEIGRKTGGALIVFITAAKVMKDGRRKYDPTHPEADVVAEDVEGWWQLQRHLDDWTRNPRTSPRVLLGAYGPIKQRFIIGSYAIAHDQWGWKERGLVKVPLLDRANHDAAQLRGRRIAGLRFGRAKWEHYLLVDGLGAVIWPPAAPSDQNG